MLKQSLLVVVVVLQTLVEVVVPVDIDIIQILQFLLDQKQSPLVVVDQEEQVVEEFQQ